MDLVTGRQDAVSAGRAVQLMAAVGKTFNPACHALYPIPAAEVEIAGVQQNPGFPGP